MSKIIKDENIQTKWQPFFLCGLVLGLIIGIIAVQTISYHVRSNSANSILGGWAIPFESIEDGQMAPKSFNFYKKTVDIETVDGDKITCNYTVKKENSLGRIIVIHDYFGGDVEISYSRQPMIHVHSRDGAWEADYYFAG